MLQCCCCSYRLWCRNNAQWNNPSAWLPYRLKRFDRLKWRKSFTQMIYTHNYWNSAGIECSTPFPLSPENFNHEPHVLCAFKVTIQTFGHIVMCCCKHMHWAILNFFLFFCLTKSECETSRWWHFNAVPINLFCLCLWSWFHTFFFCWRHECFQYHLHDPESRESMAGTKCSKRIVRHRFECAGRDNIECESIMKIVWTSTLSTFARTEEVTLNSTIPSASPKKHHAPSTKWWKFQLFR